MPTKTDNKLKWSNPGVYRILYEYGKVYIGETGRSTQQRIAEHKKVNQQIFRR